MERSSGILMHISSLYGDYGCGSFGKAAYEFIDFLEETGFTYWQVLPFCVPDSHNSPYMSYSSFGGNPNFIDLELLFEQGLLTKEELLSAKQSTPYTCEFDRLKKERMELFARAASRFSDKAKVSEFIAKNPRIEKCCEFLALKDANGGKPWTEWTVNAPDESCLFSWQFVQYEFHRQWNAVKEYAHGKNIKIIGDLPFYVAHDSSDVWSDTRQFLLDEKNAPSSVAGVPPDYFSAEGQLWGNPLYNWDSMKFDGYSWWKARMSYMFSMFDGVRIDHFRALSDYWSIPAAAKSAKEGKWVKGPRTDMIKAIDSVANGKLVIAENLGIIDDAVTELLSESKYPGMAVFQFGFDGISSNPHLPHNYKNNLVAYTGTHDNNTLLGFMWEIDDATRKYLLDYVGFTGDNFDRSYETIIRTMLASAAGTVIFPIQDILGYGSDTRLNTPGRADGNWAYRVTKEQLLSIDRAKYKKMNKMYSR